MMGYIYIFVFPNDRIKIGKSTDLALRSKSMKTFVPDSRLHCTFSVNPLLLGNIEKMILELPEYQKYRIYNSEVYNLPYTLLSELVESIKELLDYKEIEYNCSLDVDNSFDSVSISPFDYTLRFYQEEAVEKMKLAKRGKIILATGLGKSVIFNRYIYDIIVENISGNCSKFIVMCDEQTLCLELCEKMRKYYNHCYTYCSQKNIYSLQLDQILNFKQSMVLFTTYQSSKKFLRVPWYAAIYDECHRTVVNHGGDSPFNIFIEKSRAKRHYFFTATTKVINNCKYSMDNPEKYGEELVNISLRLGITLGFLNDYYIELRINSDKISALNDVLTNLDIISKAIVYFPTIASLRLAKRQLKHLKICVASSLKRYRKNNDSIEKFKSGKINIIFTCKMLRQGFDDKNVDTIIHYSPSGSVIDISQKNGRASRTAQAKFLSRIVFLCTEEEDIEDSLSDIFGQMSIIDPVIKNVMTSRNCIERYIRVYDNNNDIITESIFEYDEIVKLFDSTLKKLDEFNTLNRDLQKVLDFYREFGEYPFKQRNVLSKNIKKVEKIIGKKIYTPKPDSNKSKFYPKPYDTLGGEPERFYSRCLVIYEKIERNIEWNDKAAMLQKNVKQREQITNFFRKHINYTVDIKGTNLVPKEMKMKTVNKFSLSPDTNDIKDFLFTIDHKKIYTYDEFWESLKSGLKN